MSVALKVENLSKAYQLGEIGTGTISRDLERWFAKIRGKEDPFLKIGEVNNRSITGMSDVVWSLKDINFEINQGEAVGIIGRNGAGKSTLLKILSKVTTPTTGKITGRGRIASLLEVGTGFHPELTGRENIYLNGAILGMRKHEISKKFDEIVEFAGVSRYINTPVKRYSSGMYVRLAFAVAAHLESEILIVDEVLAVGDAEFQRKCLGKMGEISKGQGRTVLFVSHNMQSIANLCNKSILLKQGEVEDLGDTNHIIRKYQDTESANNEIHLDNYFVSYLKFEQLESSLILTCRYRNCSNFPYPFLGFGVYDEFNQKIFSTNPKLQRPNLKIMNSDSGELKLKINEPKLLNGKYKLTVWFGDGNTDYFVGEHVLSLEVTDMAHYDFATTANESGPIIPKVTWEQNIKL